MEESAGSGATIAIICIVLIVLALIIAGALIFYAKKQSIWCFKSNEVETKPNIDPEMQRPLQNTEVNEAPIIKPGLRRPQTTQAWKYFYW